MTLSSPLSSQQLKLESITDYAVPLLPKQNQETTGAKFIDANKTRTGDFYEYYVGLEAWRRDAEVFMNLGRSGPVDVIIKNGNSILECNVKSLKTDKKYDNEGNLKYPHYYPQALNSIPHYIYMVCVHPLTRAINWHKDRIPLGWEGFWK